MKLGLFFFGTVDMPDAGTSGPPAEKRNYGQADYARLYSDLIAYARRADELGYDAMWTAEHHFHNHGFEVVPNVVMFNAVLAQHTQRLRFGSLVHVLTQWHPIRFAEDFALADVLSGGRMLCGLGRGSEQRESAPFGVDYGWNSDAADRHNREVFEEQVAIFKAATNNERFAFHGKHFSIPPDGLTFRDEPVIALPLVPRPANVPVRVYQAVGSPDTVRYAAEQRHVAVLWQKPGGADDNWWRYQRYVEEFHNVLLRPGQDRLLVVYAHMGDTYEQAAAELRPGHDELQKLLWPNQIRINPANAGRPQPTLEESMQTRPWLVGTPAQVRDQLLAYHDQLQFEELAVFAHFPGMTRPDTLRQIDLLHQHVMPALSDRSAKLQAVA